MIQANKQTTTNTVGIEERATMEGREHVYVRETAGLTTMIDEEKDDGRCYQEKATTTTTTIQDRRYSLL
jgi:hypothetical protein